MITDKDRVDWLEDSSTLHNHVEILYAVWYQVTVIKNDNPVDVFEGETLREAIDKAIKSYPIIRSAND